MKRRYRDPIGPHVSALPADGVVLGSGRAGLRETVDAHGSIAAAGRGIGMGRGRASAPLTRTGRQVLARRRLERATSDTGAAGLDQRTGLVVAA